MSAAVFDERATLTRWAAAFTHACGWTPLLHDIARDELPDAGLFTLEFQPLLEPIEMLGGTGHFKHRARHVAHIRRMGFDWNDAGRVLTSPSPHSFNALADAFAGAGVGYRLAYIVEDRPCLSLGAWLLHYLRGEVPVHIGTDAFYERVLRGSRQQASGLDFHFSSLAHDLTVHALNYHLAPRRFIDAVRDRIVAALPERHAAWHAPDAGGPLTLTTFFDNDLNRYCYAMWSRTDDAAEFARMFLAEHNLAQIMACLDVRIDETQRGLGDVPSGDTKDMQPLQKFEFAIR